jgi:UDP-glucose 4-epimerase
MHAVVTGGAGFIGSHLTKKLLNLGWDVTIYDNLSSGNKSNIPQGANFIWAELTDESCLSLMPNHKVDVFYHLASHVGQELSFERPLYDLKANANSTIILLNWCLKNNVKQFIFASTMNLYGSPDNELVNESTIANPPSPYAVGKLASEYLCKIYNDFGLNTTCLRLFNVYGPGQDFTNMKQGMASIFMSYVARNEKLIVRGSKDRFRDFIFVDDVVDAFIVVQNSKAFGNIYNVSTGVKTFVWQIIEEILAAFGHINNNYPTEYAEGTPKDQFGIYGDSNKLNFDFGWKPKVGLKEGIRLMAEDAIKNKIL